MKKHDLTDLIILRATYNKTLHDAVMEGDADAFEAFLKDLEETDGDFYDFGQKVDLESLKKMLTASDKEMNAAISSGRPVFGF